MLLGFKEFKKNYLLRLFVLHLIMGSISCLYNIYAPDGFAVNVDADYNKYRLVKTCPFYPVVFFVVTIGGISLAI